MVVLFTVLCSLGVELSAQCVLSCKSSLGVSLGLDGSALMTPAILLEDPDCDPADFTVTITDQQGNNYGNVLSCANIGQTLTALVRQTSTGNACATQLTVNDYLPPFLTAPDTLLYCNADLLPQSIGFPSVQDNCASLDSTDLSYTDLRVELDCFTLFGGDTVTTRVERTWTVTDDYGNRSTTIQNIYLKRATIADIDFPPHLNGFSQPALDCQADPFDLSVVGEPTIDGRRIETGGDCEFVISYSDQIVPLCSPNSYRIIRTWTVIDWCADDFDLHAQLIELRDDTAPLIQCPADLTVGTNVDDCSAAVLLPNATATDDCSAFTITPSWAFGTGTGPFANVPQGVHEVTYTAEDACGNRATCTIQVTVVDVVPPVAVCEYSTSVDLTSDGTGTVSALSFDDGSNDNCGMGALEVGVAGGPFGPTYTFDCDDIGPEPVELLLRVYDAVGNYNHCTVRAYVSDKLKPVIVCPATAYLDCDEDYLDLSLTGQALVQDNCGIDSLYFSDDVQLNTCGVGQVVRTWTVRDRAGNTTSCLQWIYLSDPTPLTVSFPSDFSSTQCGIDLDPVLTGQPVLGGDDCELVYRGFTDDTLSAAFPACFIIHREWEIIDWCNHDPNVDPAVGYWSHTQVLSVVDLVDPVLTCPADITVGSFSADCGITPVSLPLATATDCSPTISIINDSPYATSNGADASGNYPIGVHTVRYTAFDNCGNSSQCAINITVVDSLKPVVICHDGLSLELGIGGVVSLAATTLDAGSSDNCTAASDLTFSVFPSYFTCDDLGPNEVNLTVRDAAGNETFCVATVFIQNNMGVCPFIALEGGVQMPNGRSVAGVEVEINGGQYEPLETGADGQFEFQNLPIGGNYTIKPSKLVDADNGVSTIDLILISRHLIGMRRITSPYEKIAADVDNNQRINTFDIIQLQKMILFIDTIYPVNTSWRFVDADYTFPDDDPFTLPFPEAIELNNQGQDLVDLNFRAIKIGDVSQDANPLKSAAAAADRSVGEVVAFTTPDRAFRRGERVRVPLRMEVLDDLLGFQFTLGFDPQVLRWRGLEMAAGAEDVGLRTDNFGRTQLEAGKLTASWFSVDAVDWSGGDWCYLEFEALVDGQLSDVLAINSSLTAAEAYREGIGTLAMGLHFGREVEAMAPVFEAAPVVGEMEVYNYPNPFRERTTIAVDIQTAGSGRLAVYDGGGRLLYERWISRAAGAQEIDLDRSELGAASGYLPYRVEWDDGRLYRGLMLLH